MLQDLFVDEPNLSLERDTLRKSQFDLIVLKHVALSLQLTLRQLDQPVPNARPLLYNLVERHQRTHRVVLYDYEQLLTRKALPFVGFVSRRQSSIHNEITSRMDAADGDMLHELASKPGVLSYSSCELRNGDWFNLVVLQTLEAKAHIKSSRTHAHAVTHLAPNYYSWIRLHNGLFPQGLNHSEMYLQKTKLYRFYANQPMPSMHEFMHPKHHSTADQDCTGLQKLA